MRSRRLSRFSRLRRIRYLRAWWFWVLVAVVGYLALIGLLRWLLDGYLIVSVVHEPGSADGRVLMYISLKTEFARGIDRVVVTLGQALLGPELAVESWLRTVLRR